MGKARAAKRKPRSPKRAAGRIPEVKITYTPPSPELVERIERANAAEMARVQRVGEMTFQIGWYLPAIEEKLEAAAATPANPDDKAATMRAEDAGMGQAHLFELRADLETLWNHCAGRDDQSEIARMAQRAAWKAFLLGARVGREQVKDLLAHSVRARSGLIEGQKTISNKKESRYETIRAVVKKHLAANSKNTITHARELAVKELHKPGERDGYSLDSVLEATKNLEK